MSKMENFYEFVEKLRLAENRKEKTALLMTVDPSWLPLLTLRVIKNRKLTLWKGPGGSLPLDPELLVQMCEDKDNGSFLSYEYPDKFLSAYKAKTWNVGVSSKFILSLFESKETVKPMLAKNWDGREEVYESVSYKYDGERIIVEITPSVVTITSRNGKDLKDKFPSVHALIPCGKKCVIDGELVAYENGRILPFSAVVSTNTVVDYRVLVFDVISLEGSHDNTAPLELREQAIDQVLPRSKLFIKAGIFRKSKPYKEHLEDAVALGYEGIMMKDLSSPYSYGERKWWKMKKSYTLDLKVTALQKGKGKFEGMWAIMVLETLESLELCKCGSGLNDDERKILQTKGSPDDKGNLAEPYIVEVGYDDIIYTKGVPSLRFPRFIRFRDDKTSPDSLPSTVL